MEAEYTIEKLCNALSVLVKPAEKDNAAGDLHNILELNIKNALESLSITEEDTAELLLTIKCSFSRNSGVRWRFVCVSLYILLALKKCLSEKMCRCKSKEEQDPHQPPPDILSVSQQKTIRTCLQFIISMGVLPSLLPGVGISLAARSTSAQKLRVEELVVLEIHKVAIRGKRRISGTSDTGKSVEPLPVNTTLVPPQDFGENSEVEPSTSKCKSPRGLKYKYQSESYIKYGFISNICDATLPLCIICKQAHGDYKDRYERLSGVTRGLVACFEQPTLRSLILVQHLGDLIAALAQLSFAPLKKPVNVTPVHNVSNSASTPSTSNTATTAAAGPSSASSPSSSSLSSVASASSKQESSGEEFVMTPELWGRLQEERSHFKKCFLSLVNKLYQPLIIRELILLHGSARSKHGVQSSPPTWLKRCCIPLLVQCLIKPGGVSALVRAICDSSCDIGADWRKLDTVVKVILTVHVQHAEQYYKNICSQIVEMLNVGDRTQSQLYTTVSLLCMKALSSEKPLMFQRYILDVLMNPLLLCCNVSQHGPTFYREVPLLFHKLEELKLSAESDAEECVIVCEEELSKSISNLHKCFVTGAGSSEMSTIPSENLFSIASVLFHLHLHIRQSASHLKTKVEELLLKFLSSCNQKQLQGVFNAFLFGDQVEGMLEVSEQIDFAFGSTGGVEVKLRKKPRKEYFSEEAGDCLVELLEKGDKKGDVTNSLFVFLLRLLSDPKSDLALLESERRKLGGKMNEVRDAVILNIVGRSERNIVAVRLLAILAENSSIHEKLTEDPTHVIFFVQYLLERDASLLTKKDGNRNAGVHDTESLFMILMVLSVVVNNASSRHINWEPFKRLVEPLRVIHENVVNEELKMFTEEVCNKILSHGIVQRSTTSSRSCTNSTQCSTNKPKSERHGKNSGNNDTNATKRNAASSATKSDVTCQKSNTSSKSQADGENRKESRCKQALFEVCDTMLPIRGHALIELAKLISSGDKEAQRHRNQILRIFQENLKHEDSYIYLSSINGLAVMANVFPNTVIKALVEEYEEMRTKRNLQDNNNSSAELKMKVGEVLVRVTKSLGDLVPPYKAMLLNAFLVGTKDSDPLVRASSLSNLGEICKALGFRIGPIVTEILMCVRSIVQSDPTVEVRRAAVLVVTLLLQGLGQDTLKVLEDILLDLYRTLKTLYQHETDDVLKLHVQLALEELNKSVVEFLFPQPKLEKRLYVIDPPES